MYTHTVQGKVEHWFSSDKLTNDGCWYGPPDGTYFLIIPPPPPPVASLLFIRILLKMFLPVRYMEDSCIHVQHWKWRYLTSTCIPLKLTNEKWWCLHGSTDGAVSFQTFSLSFSFSSCPIFLQKHSLWETFLSVMILSVMYCMYILYTIHKYIETMLSEDVKLCYQTYHWDLQA